MMISLTNENAKLTSPMNEVDAIEANHSQRSQAAILTYDETPVIPGCVNQGIEPFCLDID